MAKKNSSKTATEKAIQSSEPRVVTFKDWQGVNFVDAPLTWNPLESGQNKFRQTDLPNNYLMIQNNLVTTDTLGIETRQDSIVIGKIDPEDQQAYENYDLTGVGCVYKRWLFCVARWTYNNPASGWYEDILYRDLTDTSSITTWNIIHVSVGGIQPSYYEIQEIGFFEGNLVATARKKTPNQDEEGVLLLAKVETNDDESTISINGMDWQTHTESRSNFIVDTPKISPETDRPGIKPGVDVIGMQWWDPDEYPGGSVPETAPVRVEVKFCYTNRLGSTLTQTDENCKTMYVEYSPALWSAKRYMIIRPETELGEGEDHEISIETRGDTVEHSSVSGIDFYGRDTENTDWVFIGHIDVTPNQVTRGTWQYRWYGNMTDISQWLTAQLMVPTENTTHGPDATHFSHHDSRMYYWGMPSKPYRLWIGGNPGSEFSIARGLGGAWVDIEPGSGFDIQGTEKWKTVSGANIVTILCGNRNTTKIERFNLVETNLTLTNEVAYKSYMYEQVSNVVGCNSRWGHGVFGDGLYCINRYGLMLTTMAMEYNSQMKNQKVSDVIDPIFTERIGKRLRDSRLVCINDIIFIVLSEDPDDEGDEPVGLDNVILCYDMNLKAWYTWTHDQSLNNTMGNDQDHILHVLPIDSDEFIEGLGTITKNEVRLYPITGIQEANVPDFQVILETGELAPRQPTQAFWYLQQLEFRFDYFIGDPDNPAEILVEGVDYYGRQFKITKQLNIKSRGHHGLTGEQRNYVEWIRVDKIVESFRIRIKGKARFRLTHINAKMYQQADTIGTPYGFDAYDTYYNRHGEDHEIHHYIDDYNNLRRAVIS